MGEKTENTGESEKVYFLVIFFNVVNESTLSHSILMISVRQKCNVADRKRLLVSYRRLVLAIYWWYQKIKGLLT